jgi:hypothetical protein
MTQTVHLLSSWRTCCAALAAAWVLVACGGGGGGAEAPAAAAPLPPVLAAATPFGPASDPAPTGAVEVSADELQRLAQAGAELVNITPAGEAAVGDSDADRRRTARRTVEAALGRYPELAAVLQTPSLPASAVRRADGTVAVTLPQGGAQVLLDPYETAIDDAAYALRMSESRENLLELYATYLDLLSDEDRQGLPTPAEASQRDLAALREAVSGAAERVIETVPNEPLPGASTAQAVDSRAHALGGLRPLLAGSGCPASSGSLIDEFGFTLKPHLGPVRSQGNRATCSSFAAAAAVEIKASRLYGRASDLSEQHLYSTARLDWFRVSGDFAEGMVSGDLLDRLKSSGYGFRGETQWTYNRARDRIELSGGYRNSCNGYDEACSDTNHQARRLCAVVNNVRWCFWQKPTLADQGVAEQTRISSLTWLGPLGPVAKVQGTNNQTLTYIRAHLAAGNPVYLSTDWVECMKSLDVGAVPPSIGQGVRAILTVPRCQDYGDSSLGGHAVTIVGWVPTLEAAARLGARPGFPTLDGNPVTDGFFIIRNSHGCDWADGGYGYFSSEMLRRYARNAWSINLVSTANRPTLTVKVDRSVIDAPDEVATLTATPGPTVRRVALYKVDRNDSSKATLLEERTSGPFSWQLAIGKSAANLGLHRYYAIGYDAAGAAVTSMTVSVQLKGSALPPPTLTLTAGSTSVLLPGSVLLTAEGERGSTTANRTPLRLLEFFKDGVRFASYSYPLAENRAQVTQSRLEALSAADAGVVRFSARLTDDAGAMATAEVQVTVTQPAAPRITSFAATPSTAPPGGGPVMLAWTASDFQSLVIDRIGPVTSLNSVQVNPSVTTTYVLTATSQGGTANASTTVTVPPPRIDSFTATPASLPVGGGAVTLAWSVTGAPGVSISNVGTLPPSGTTVVNVNASTSWQLSAAAPSGTSFAQAAVTVAQDTVAPTVSLAASPATVDAPGSTTLTASATDNVGVVAVDFFRGALRIGTDTTPGDGFTQTVSFTQAEAGSISFTAVARDAGGNATTSLPVVVTVRVPTSVDRWVAPTGSDANPGTQAAPYLTVGKALANIGSNGTVWLAAGAYPWANEINRNGVSQLDFKTLRMPAGARVRAIARGTVTLQFGLVAQGAATVSGVHFTLVDSDVTNAQPSVVSVGAAGPLRLERTTFGRLGNLLYTAGGDITFTAEGDANHEWFTSEFQGAFGRVDGGLTRMIGGRVTLNRIPDGSNASVRLWGIYGGSGRISFEGVRFTLPEAPLNVFQMLFQPIQGGTLEFVGSEVVQQGSRFAHVLAQNDHQSLVRLVNTSVSGPFAQVLSLTVGGNVELNGATLSGGSTGIGFAGGQEPGGVARPVVQIIDSTLRGFGSYGVHLPNHGDVTVQGSTIRDNGRAGIHMAGVPNLPWVTANYALRVSGSTIANNGSGGADHGGVVMAGSAGSVWNLGLDGLGNNVLLGVGGTPGSPALRVAVPAGVTVQASGNLWTPSVQGADAGGRYSGDRLATGGSGTNYVVTGGALRLAP